MARSAYGYGWGGSGREDPFDHRPRAADVVSKAAARDRRSASEHGWRQSELALEQAAASRLPAEEAAAILALGVHFDLPPVDEPLTIRQQLDLLRQVHAQPAIDHDVRQPSSPAPPSGLGQLVLVHYDDLRFDADRYRIEATHPFLVTPNDIPSS